MEEEKDQENKGTLESFAKMFKEFGSAVAEIFNDPALKEKAKEFGESAVESAKALGGRFKDEDVKNKFKDVGMAAQSFGQKVADSFKEEKKTQETGSSQEGPQEQEEQEQEEDDGDAQEASGLESKIDQRIEEKFKTIDEKAKKAEKKIDDYFKSTRGGRIAGYSIAIFWNIAFLIFFNFYYDYIAVYTPEGRIPILTENWRACLPVLSIAFLVAIIGNIVLIIYDRYELRQVIEMITNLLGIAAVVTLLYLFPFDFSVIPLEGLSLALTPIVTVVLILIAIGLGVSTLVRFIKLVLHISKT